MRGLRRHRVFGATGRLLSNVSGCGAGVKTKAVMKAAKREHATDGEGHDVASLDLTGGAVSETGAPTVVVLVNGRPLSYLGQPSTFRQLSKQASWRARRRRGCRCAFWRLQPEWAAGDHNSAACQRVL